MRLWLWVAFLWGGCSTPPAAPLQRAPDGMIAVAAGSFHRDGAMVHVAAFALDRAPVTVGEFRSSGIDTLASRSGGGTFSMRTGRFSITDGADFAHPLGDGVFAPDEEPATQVTASEAEAYCAQRGARLPTSDEWEHAARNARDDRTAYPWGDEPTDDRGAWRMNAWQGAFPTANTLADGYLFASPVGAFDATPLGFLDLVGNVWQWTSTPWTAEATNAPSVPSAGPDARVIRGGSFLCDARVCHGYRIDSARAADPDSPLMHLGFRCAHDG